ncbi:MAG: V-type ATPase subunit [Thermoplasmatales archaeon]|nr:MAG: V-type ATPase subunit [Thermoplasmatales archaeon]
MLELILDPHNLPFWILIASIIVVVIGLISRPFLTHAKFAYSNALFEAIGNPYINDKELSNIVESKDLIAFKETINSLKDYNVVGEDTYTVQKSLDDNFIQTIEMMRKDSSKKMKDFYDIYLEKIDIYLVKNELKKLILGKVEEVEIDNAILPRTKEFLSKLKDVGKENLPAILASYGFEKELIDILSEANPDILTIDVEIDKHIINKFKQVEVPYKCEQAKQSFMKSLIDITNIKNILRAKQLGYDVGTCKKLFLEEGKEIATWKFNEMADVDQVPQVISALEGTSYFNVLKDSIEQYNKEGSVQVLENALDGLLIKLVKDISLQNFLNLGPTLRFLVSKEFEIKNLKVVAKGIGENLSSDLIKGLLIKEAA